MPSTGSALSTGTFDRLQRKVEIVSNAVMGKFEDDQHRGFGFTLPGEKVHYCVFAVKRDLVATYQTEEKPMTEEEYVAQLIAAAQAKKRAAAAANPPLPAAPVQPQPPAPDSNKRKPEDDGQKAAKVARPTDEQAPNEPVSPSTAVPPPDGGDYDPLALVTD